MRFSEKENFSWNHDIFQGDSLEGSKKNMPSHSVCLWPITALPLLPERYLHHRKCYNLMQQMQF